MDRCPDTAPTHELHPVALQAREPQVAALQAEVLRALSQAAADGASWNQKVMELQVSGFLLDSAVGVGLLQCRCPPAPEAAPLVS